ncbi:hypothetical protein GCM10011297_06220 [Bacterioplanes sanyensis]|nr:hypothetical protein GCM10011297_06220 [Bacterioplanes sanyensis]
MDSPSSNLVASKKAGQCPAFLCLKYVSRYGQLSGSLAVTVLQEQKQHDRREPEG